MLIIMINFLRLLFLISPFIDSTQVVHQICIYSSTREGETFGERSALDLLSRMSSKKIPPNARLLDLGCGTAEVSKTIAEELMPFGTTILGVDNNKEAIEKALIRYPKTQHPNLDLGVGDACDLPFSNEFDILTSISLFHLVGDPRKLADSTFRVLKPHGRAIIQVPAAFPDALEKATAEVIARDKWQKHFNGFSRGWNEVSGQLFEKQGFTIKRQIRFLDSQTLESVDKFKSFVGNWYPYLRPIPEEYKEEFLQDVISCYLKFQPALPDGRVLFATERIEFELEKP